MVANNQNLRLALEHLHLSNRMVANALSVDPSLISKWIKGSRKLLTTSEVCDKLCDYVLSKAQSTEDIEWFRTQFAKGGLPTTFSSVNEIKQNLIFWLAHDSGILKQSFRAVRTQLSGPDTAQSAECPSTVSEFEVKTTFFDVANALRGLLAPLPHGAKVDIHLSKEDIVSITHDMVSSVLLAAITAQNLQVRLLISLSSDTNAMSKLIRCYMYPIVTANLKISVVHGMTQTTTNQMNVLTSDRALLVTEAPKTTAGPIAVVVEDELFLRDLKKSFERAINGSQPILQIYSDSFARNILEIIYMEFCLPGDLDVIKDSINPMYMSAEGYNRVLRLEGHRGDQFKWRSEEFIRFNAGLNENLAAGANFREIISLARLRKIIDEGYCRMPSLYFMNKGCICLDAAGCVDLLNGYITALNTYPNFNLAVVDCISELNADCCWRLKSNHHIALSYWDNDEPFLIYSDQLMLTYEFQNHFNEMWLKSGYSSGQRHKTIAILTGIIQVLQEKYV